MSRPAFLAFVAGWAATTGAPAYAASLDATLHRDRVARMRGLARWPTTVAGLPFGSFFRVARGDGTPWVQLDDGAAAWSPAGNTTRIEWPRSTDVELLTPPATVIALRAGYRPVIHPTVESARWTALGKTRSD